MSSDIAQPPEKKPIRHTLRVFGPFFAILIGISTALVGAVWFEFPREVIIALSFVLAGAAIVGPYIWYVVRFFALSSHIPLVWTRNEEMEEIHCTLFSPRAFDRLHIANDELVEKSTFAGSAYVGIDLRREEVTPELQTDPVERYVVDGTWRGSLDWWSFEVSAEAMRSIWEDLVPRVKESASAQGRSSSRAVTLATDEAGAILSGVEQDVLYDGDGVDLDQSLTEWFDDELAETLEETAPVEEDKDVEEEAREATDPLAEEPAVNGEGPDD